MRKMNTLLKQGRKLYEDTALLKILQSEIRHEISHPRFQNVQTGSLGDFKLDWDSPVSRDIVLRRRFDSGEEVVVSALLQQEPISDEHVDEHALAFPREALAKVCIKKPGISSIMQFDCEVYELAGGGSDFKIEKTSLIRSLASPRPMAFPELHHRKIKLQDRLKDYLISKGIEEGLTNFLMCHLNKKEQDQYVNWLRRLESTMLNSVKP